MKSKKTKLFIAFFMIFLTILNIFPSVARAAEDNTPAGEMIPSISDLYKMSNNKYFTTYKDNYYLDLEDVGLFKGLIGRTLNVLANFFFMLEVLLCQLVIVIVYYTFEISIFDIFSKPINAIISSMQDTIFNEFMYVAVSTIVIYYIVKTLRNQTTQVWSALLTMIVIVAMAFTFFKSPVTVLKSINDVTDSVSQAVLEGTYKATNDGEASLSVTQSIANNLWVMFVHKPWQIYEFGSTKAAATHEDKILSLTPESEDRQDYIDKIAKESGYCKTGMGAQRAALSLVYLVLFIVVGAVIVCICALIIGYQFLTILFSTFGPIVFLIALIPFFGVKTLQSWAAKIIGFASLKIILSLILSVLFAFILACFDLVDTYGLLIMALIIAVVVLVVWLKRDSIIDSIFKLTAVAKESTPQNFRRTFRYDSHQGSMRNNVKSVFHRNSVGSSNNGGSLNNGGNANMGGQASGYNWSTSNSKGRKNRSNRGKGNSQVNANGYIPSDALSRDIAGVNSNLIGLRQIAEEILEERYSKSKNESEVKAEAMNKEPEYSPWVRQVMNREAMNLPKFEEREKQAVVNQIMDIRDQGGDISDIREGDNQVAIEDILAPKGVVSEEPIKLNIAEKASKSDDEASREFVSTFNTEFGKNYNENFMGNLVGAYGQENVEQVINDMVRINKDKGIQNPAGYMISALKNNSNNQIKNSESSSNATVVKDKFEVGINNEGNNEDTSVDFTSASTESESNDSAVNLSKNTEIVEEEVENTIEVKSIANENTKEMNNTENTASDLEKAKVKKENSTSNRKNAPNEKNTNSTKNNTVIEKMDFNSSGISDE